MRMLSLSCVSGATFFAAVLTSGCGSKAANSGNGSGGNSGSGGAGNGSGGSNGPICTASDDDLISDFTTDNGVHQVDNRQGGWYTYGDKSGFGVLMPPEGGSAAPDLTAGNTNCSGPGSLHVIAMTFNDWGAATGVDFVASSMNPLGARAKGTYDATKYRGVAFWAKSAAGKPIKFVQVSFLDPYTAIPSILSNDQACAYSKDPTNPAMTAKNCSPYLVKFGYGYTGDDATAQAEDYPGYVKYEIDDTWRRFEILFSDTKQDRNNPGQQSPGNKLAVSQLTGMAIQVNSDHSTKPPTANDFEIWIDDVSFVK